MFKYYCIDDGLLTFPVQAESAKNAVQKLLAIASVINGSGGDDFTWNLPEDEDRPLMLRHIESNREYTIYPLASLQKAVNQIKK